MIPRRFDLLVIDDHLSVHPVRSPAELILGRGPEADIPIDVPAVSRAHARLRVQDQGVWLEDLGSRNGTFLDSVRLTPHCPHPLPRRARFQVADVQLVLRRPRHLRGRTHPTPTLSQAPLLAGFWREQLSELEGLGRLARPIAFLGERGTGKSLAATLLHERARAPAPLHLLPGQEAAPVALRTFRPSRSGGTLLVESLDRMPHDALALLPALEARLRREHGWKLVATALAPAPRSVDALLRAGGWLVAHLPALRTRPNEIAELAEAVLARESPHRGARFSDDALLALRDHRWPGNLHELWDCVARASHAGREVVEREHLGIERRAAPTGTPLCLPAED